MEENNLLLWENIFQTREWGSYPPLALVRFIARNYYKAPDRSEVHILELGSGAGANLWYIAREGFSAYGIDASETACKILIEKLKKEGLISRLKRIDSGDYLKKIESHPDNFFDAIIDIGSLCCNSFNKTQEIIQKASNKLKLGGKLFSCTFAEGTWGLDAEQTDHHACYPVEGPLANLGFNRYSTLDDIQKLYGSESLRIVSVQKQELHFDTIHSIKDWLIESEKVK